MEQRGWDHVSDWYDNIVSFKGHYYHQNIIFPNLLKIFKDYKIATLLDLGCGQGVLARVLPRNTTYFGVDISKNLISSAKSKSRCDKSDFAVQDITEAFELPKTDFDAATCVLTLQDLQDSWTVFKNAAKHLRKDGLLICVLNHPCFRIPRQTSWEVDTNKKIQSRKMNVYQSELKIPIQTAPSKGSRSETVYHHHRPLSYYFQGLCQAGFTVEALDEWYSDKMSTGKNAKMENRARKEFPLFLCLVCKLIRYN